MLKNNLKIKGGYTIMETMIAVSLFIIIIMTGMNSLLNANLLHQKSQGMRSIIDNLSFVLEDISRNLRTGYGYHCFATGDVIPGTTSDTMSVPKSCGSGWGISFEATGGLPSNDGVSDAKDNDQWVYFIGTNGIDPKVRIYKSILGPYAAANFIQLTPDEVTIDSASGFSVLGAESPSATTPDFQQPFVTIKLVGSITFKNIVTPFSLQTSVSQRLIDI